MQTDPREEPMAPQKRPEKSPRGRILLVGFGPGHPDHLTFRAHQAITEAQVVVGYSTYIELVEHLLEGKEVIEKGMTEELDRCELALERARKGQVVALISSGDVGVYGMAGPTFEVLQGAGWRPEGDVEVEVVPGVTALSACAARVGAPLTHDFCAISLSDLLTPWAVIEKRLKAAAESDFVVALYNPKSGRRTQQIVRAREILLMHRDPNTPVALVKSAYREREEIILSTLDDMLEHKIGMLTTVLVGSSNTYVFEGLMVTPRGYANKYDLATGAVRPGEKPGRSLSSGLATGA
jgi:precorrin-3B C17-methyltransferase / cobalt-factor III methyltransferase